MGAQNLKSKGPPTKFIPEETMSKEALRELFIDELRDIYDAEHRLVKALPKLADASNSEDLRAGFKEHLEQTKGHVERLNQIFESLNEKSSGKKCAAMVGLIAEGEEMMDADFEGAVKDAALISAAQRVEHYEIAAYGCVKTWAGLLGETEAQSLLEETLNEEKTADEKLTELSESINLEAEGEEGEEKRAEEQSQKRPVRGKARSAKA
jgi:ferritin-like metal-binding protein YciE